MSIVLHRAIGYGMPWKRFEQLFRERNDIEDVHEELFARARSVDPADLIISKDYARATFPGLIDEPGATYTPPHVLERNLLAKTVTLGGIREAALGRPDQLFTTVCDPDNTHEIMFFPGMMRAATWYHYGDCVDFAFELWGRESNGKRYLEDAPRAFTKYLETGHSPFNELLMHPDGRPAEHDYWWRGENRDALIPGVPEEIRFFIEALRLMPKHGVAELRPMLAQWWC